MNGKFTANITVFQFSSQQLYNIENLKNTNCIQIIEIINNRNNLDAPKTKKPIPSSRFYSSENNINEIKKQTDIYVIKKIYLIYENNI